MCFVCFTLPVIVLFPPFLIFLIWFICPLLAFPHWCLHVCVPSFFDSSSLYFGCCHLSLFQRLLYMSIFESPAQVLPVFWTLILAFWFGCWLPVLLVSLESLCSINIIELHQHPLPRGPFTSVTSRRTSSEQMDCARHSQQTIHSTNIEWFSFSLVLNYSAIPEVTTDKKNVQ